MKLANVSELVNPETGKTWKEENLELQHNIPIGSLVEVKFDRWLGGGACMKVHARLWVAKHTRDCDGTPLYSLSRWKDPEVAHYAGSSYHGFTEDNLSVIEVTQDIADGYDALEWDDEQ